MYVSMHPDPERSGAMVFKLRALKLGDYYVGSKNFSTYEFYVPSGWDPHPVCVSILETVTEDDEKPISIWLGSERIRIDPIMAGELFDCLFAFTIIKDHQ